MPVSSPTTRIQPFLLSGYHGEPTRGSVTIQAFDREQRFRRAVAGLGKWWGIGLLTVLIPVAHFVLVPSRSEERRVGEECGSGRAHGGANGTMRQWTEGH